MYQLIAWNVSLITNRMKQIPVNSIAKVQKLIREENRPTTKNMKSIVKTNFTSYPPVQPLRQPFFVTVYNQPKEFFLR